MFRLFISVMKSIGNAVHDDPEVQALAKRHPRLLGFLRKRLNSDDRFGLHLTVGVVLSSFF